MLRETLIIVGVAILGALVMAGLLVYATSANDDTAGTTIGYLALVPVALLVYFTPVIVAHVRKVPNRGSILVINVFLGWTLLGWVAALALAARDVRP